MKCDFTLLVMLQLEDVEVTVADHVQKVLKANFAASWEEVGPENELEDTYALATVNTLEGLCCRRNLDSSFMLLYFSYLIEFWYNLTICTFYNSHICNLEKHFHGSH